MVTLGTVGEAEVLVCQRVQDAIEVSGGKREDALGGGYRLIIRT